VGDNEVIDVSKPPGETLIERGEALVAQLSRHAPVRDALVRALELPVGAPPTPIYFHVRTPSADLLPWELLYAAPHGFCALDARWPIVRIARLHRPVTDRPFTPPLRLVAVLSAAGRTGVPQLNALMRALATPDAAAIGVSLHVITGEEAVVAAAAGVPRVTTELIAPTTPELARQIAAAEPDILHVLCHGGVVGGVRTLTFGLIADFDDPDAAGGSLRMSVAELVGALLPVDPWLVVLSACETADATAPETEPIAHEMVSGGIPAAIGMRRLVDLTDANRFCQALYPEVLAVVRRALAVDAPPAQRRAVHTIEWAPALCAPRRVMGGADPSKVDSWTDPVLYVQYGPLGIFQPSDRLSAADYAAMRAKIDTFEKFLLTLDPATTAPGVIAEVRMLIDALNATLAQAGI
jgi:hypothetical protein